MEKSMRCLELRERGGELVPGERRVPAIEATDVLIEIEATGVGQTVYNKLYRSDRVSEDRLPLIPGHELVGRVVETGSGVSHVDSGDLVTTHYYLLCGHCQACVSGREQWCENRGGQVGVEVDGGYAEYARIPGASTIKLPEVIDPIDATVVSDAVGTPYHICHRRADIGVGDQIMILGAGGGVGIHLVQMARLFGAEVTAVDISAEKLEAAADAGASHTINTTERSVAQAVEALGIGFDVIADFTGSSVVISDALKTLGRQGRFINLTTVVEEPLSIQPTTLVGREIEVVGSRYCSRAELMKAADLVASNAIEPVIHEVVGLVEIPELLDKIVNGEVVGRGAVCP